MAKIVKKKRKLKLQNLLKMVCVLCGISYFSSTFFLRSVNVSMSVELQNLSAQNQEQKKELETLRTEVSKYTERDYLMAICASNGVKLDYDKDRVTYIDEKE